MEKYPTIAETIMTFRGYEHQALAAYRLAEWKHYDPFYGENDSFTLYFSDKSALIDDPKNEIIKITNSVIMEVKNA